MPSVDEPGGTADNGLARIVAGVLLLVGCALCRNAQAEIIERVVAVVNDDAILFSDLRRKAAPYLAQVMAQTDSEVQRMAQIERLYKELLERLVNEKLIEQTARKMHVTVTNEDIDRAIATVRQQNSMSEEDFWKAVRSTGATKASYRSDIRKQLLRMKVVNQRVRTKVRISRAAVREKYDQQLRAARRKLRFRAAHVFFELRQGAAATEASALRARAEAVQRELTSESFDAATEQYGGGDLGWLSQGDLPSELEQALLGLEAGQISPVVRGPSGLHVFLLKERQRASEQLPTFEEAQAAVHRQMLESAMARQEKVFLDDLRRRAVIVNRLQ